MRLTDFGLACLSEEFKDSRSIEGTPAYMAPELFSGREASVSSDLYALGLVLYEIFTGKAAFHAATTADLVRMQRDSQPTHPTEIAADIDPIVERVILRCLEKDPAARPASALAVSAALPGGDPLAAALEAGETPSPEMVAAAGDQGALSPALAWAVLAYVLGGLGLILMLSGSTSILNFMPQKKTPEALADRSRELIRSLGYRQAPADAAYGYEETDFIARVKKERNQRDKLDAGQPPGLTSAVSFSLFGCGSSALGIIGFISYFARDCLS